jgi:MoaA/NifB/PqqE/SkfB family radical SAM enzyme
MKKLSIAWALLRSKFDQKRVPLFVSWIISNRCNYRCAYCNPLPGGSDELATGEVFAVVEELVSLGTKKISFTGGEPLLRDDLGAILRFCGQKGLVTSVNSNGSLVPQRIHDISSVDILNLSLDGPEFVHDTVRGPGSFRDVMRAVDVAKRQGVKISFFVTLSKFNLDHLEFFLEIARKHGCLVNFQPGEIKTLRGPGLNPHVHAQDKYGEFMARLIAAKRTNRHIGNSITGLKHLSRWPHPHPMMVCYGGKLFCRIDARGDVKICGRANGTRPAGNVREGGFKKAFDNIQPVSCDLCWCAHRVEFNYVLAGDLPALRNCFRIG